LLGLAADRGGVGERRSFPDVAQCQPQLELDARTRDGVQTSSAIRISNLASAINNSEGQEANFWFGRRIALFPLGAGLDWILHEKYFSPQGV